MSIRVDPRAVPYLVSDLNGPSTRGAVPNFGITASSATHTGRTQVTGFDGRSGGFGVSIDFVGEEAVLGLRGVLDELALPGLEALFEAVIASGYPSIAVELADLDFMSPVGLTVITNAAERIAGRDGRFDIRWPSASMRALLNSNGLADLIRTPPTELNAISASTSADSNELARMSGRVIGVPTSDVVVDTALRLVVALASDIVGGADGVSVSLRRHGKLATVAASDQTISDMDANQYATGEGPCVDASFQGREFHVESLSTDAVAGVHAAGFGPRYQRHPLLSPYRLRSSRRFDEHLLPFDLCLPSRRPEIGVRPGRRDLHDPDRGRRPPRRR